MGTHRYSWQGIDEPGRTDVATVEFGLDGMRAFGTATAPDFATVWQLDVAPDWSTRALRVTSRGLGWSRSLVLTRDDADRWTAETDGVGDTDLPPAGLADPRSVDGALDCDLGLCPLTNTMPIRRLGLLHDSVAPTTLTMAWVDVPSLRVIRSDQIYGSAGPGRVSYDSANRDFHAELTVDGDGVVIDYPGLAARRADGWDSTAEGR